MTNEQQTKARERYYYDRRTVEEIAAELHVPERDIRALLNLDVAPAGAAERPAPAPTKPVVDLELAYVRVVNEVLRLRTSEDVDPQGGKRRDGSPAPRDPFRQRDSVVPHYGRELRGRGRGLGGL